MKTLSHPSTCEFEKKLKFTLFTVIWQLLYLILVISLRVSLQVHACCLTLSHYLTSYCAHILVCKITYRSPCFHYVLVSVSHLVVFKKRSNTKKLLCTYSFVTDISFYPSEITASTKKSSQTNRVC
jgi:hypothetical protein